MTQRPVYRGSSYRTLLELNAWTKQHREAALEPDLPIVDPHHHLWEDELRGRYLLNELVEDIDSGHNIAATVFVETPTGSKRSYCKAAMPREPVVKFTLKVVGFPAIVPPGPTVSTAGIIGMGFTTTVTVLHVALALSETQF